MRTITPTTRLRDSLGYEEAQLLLAIESLQGRAISSGILARHLDGYRRERETVYQRANVLRYLNRLEHRGLIQRGPTGGWMGLTLTQLGRTRANVERVMPGFKPKAVHRDPYKVPEGTTRTRFLNKVVPVGEEEVLKPGSNNGKIGDEVLKGHYRGYRIYTLTLEERNTCPTTCERWRDCYGNNMQFARRYIHNDSLMPRLDREVDALLKRHPDGVLLRLHVLGDFYSVAYVKFWAAQLRKHPKLAIFGYTANQPLSWIGQEIRRTSDQLGWRRFAIRWSTSIYEWEFCATWYKPVDGPPPHTFACPEQLERVLTCGHCAACWEGIKTVAFELH